MCSQITSPSCQRTGEVGRGISVSHCKTDNFPKTFECSLNKRRTDPTFFYLKRKREVSASHRLKDKSLYAPSAGQLKLHTIKISLAKRKIQ